MSLMVSYQKFCGLNKNLVQGQSSVCCNDLFLWCRYFSKFLNHSWYFLFWLFFMNSSSKLALLTWCFLIILRFCLCWVCGWFWLAVLSCGSYLHGPQALMLPACCSKPQALMILHSLTSSWAGTRSITKWSETNIENQPTILASFQTLTKTEQWPVFFFSIPGQVGDQEHCAVGLRPSNSQKALTFTT